MKKDQTVKGQTAKDQTVKDKTTKGKMANIRTRFDQRKTSQHKATRCISTVIKPLRIFQFFVVLLVFVFTTYMIAIDPTPMSALACILLIVLSGIYVFIYAVEIISHFAGSALHIIPMSIFSFLGLLFFGTAGILLICNDYTQLVMQIATVTSCLLAALLFAIDVTMVLSFWKKRCSVCKRCCNNDGTELLLREEEPLAKTVTVTEAMKHDVTTSLSEVRVLPELEGIETTLPDHCSRKVGYPRRREYVDCPTCVPSLCALDVAQIQTEPHRVSVVESQTPSTSVKETPIQTLSKCELCQQQIQIPFTAPIVDAAAPSGQCFQHPQMTYPAIVQIVRGGMPCCSGCKCTTTQQQGLAQSLARTSAESNSSKTLTSETTQQVTNAGYGTSCEDITRLTRGMGQTITKVTVASFYVKPDKRIQTSQDSVPKRNANIIKIKEDAKPTSEDVSPKFTKEIITTIAKDEESEIIDEEIVHPIDDKEEKDEMGIEEREEPNEDESNDKIERSKGGGEQERTRTYQQFMHATQQRDMMSSDDSPRHTVATQVSATTLIGRTKPRPFLHLKSNKVDPVKNASVSDKGIISETVASSTDERIESLNRIEHQVNDGCSFCRRQKSLTPISDNSRYYTVFKDRKGRYFCEFCAPLDSKKITCRLEVTDMKKLQCANCRFTFRERRIKTNVKLKSDICPKCGQSQYAASPSSM